MPAQTQGLHSSNHPYSRDLRVQYGATCCGKVASNGMLKVHTQITQSHTVDSTLEYGTICAMVWWQGCAVAAQTQISLQGRSPTRCRPLVVHHEVHREDGVTLGSPRPPRVRSPHPPRVTLGSTRIAFSSPPPSLGGCQPYVWETYLLKKVKSTEFLISCRRVSNPCYPICH